MTAKTAIPTLDEFAGIIRSHVETRGGTTTVGTVQITTVVEPDNQIFIDARDTSVISHIHLSRTSCAIPWTLEAHFQPVPYTDDEIASFHESMAETAAEGPWWL